MIGSGPRYFTASRMPKTIWRPNRISATAKYGYATNWDRKRMAGPSAEGHEVGDELIDLSGVRRSSVLAGMNETPPAEKV
jgi:hypothetical protein